MSNRPVCVNHGCDRLVTSSGTRYRPFCSSCHKAGYDSGKKFTYGILPFRTGKCTNDGFLGFECSIDYDKAPWAIGITEVDHMDGNHMNNSLRNVVELCPMCHKQKTKLFGDFKNQNRAEYSYKRLQ